jgi:hypothetical protein
VAAYEPCCTNQVAADMASFSIGCSVNLYVKWECLVAALISSVIYLEKFQISMTDILYFLCSTIDMKQHF